MNTSFLGDQTQHLPALRIVPAIMLGNRTANVPAVLTLCFFTAAFIVRLGGQDKNVESIEDTTSYLANQLNVDLYDAL